MKSSPNQGRQVGYAVGILVLFVAMFPFTQWLRGLKERRQLGEATIGQVDAGSFMLKLALLGGARGVAANVLWGRALDLQKAHDWDRLKVTVDQITKLQPHFLRVWSWQGWNLAYNVSVEWDAPEDKYDWIKQGINFLKEGVRKNEKSPDLLWDTAWTYFQKVGTADEAIILRRLFHDDDEIEFRTVDVDGRRQTFNDNFLVAHGWFGRAVDLVDGGANRLTSAMEANVEYVDKVESRKGLPGDLHFRSMPASALTRFASALEKASVLNLPPTFGERARSEWTRAKDAWIAFGQHPFPAHSLIPPEHRKQLIFIDDSTEPAQFRKRIAEMRLTKPQADNQEYWTNRWSDTTHYRYWKDRALAEMEPGGVEARRLFYEGTRAFKQADFPKAVEKFRDGLDRWQDVLAQHPIYRDDDLNKQDTGRVVRRYIKALANAGMERPKVVPFEKLIDTESPPDPFDQTDMPVASMDGDTPIQ